MSLPAPHASPSSVSFTFHTLLQVDTLQLLALRRKLSGHQAGEEGSKVGLDGYVQQLAAHLPQPERASGTLGQLLQVKDNHAFAVMQTALAPGASAEVGRFCSRVGRHWCDTQYHSAPAVAWVGACICRVQWPWFVQRHVECSNAQALAVQYAVVPSTKCTCVAIL